MKMHLLLLLVLVALAGSAKDREVTLRVDTQRQSRPSFPCGVPCIGYVADPVIGDESAALACRRAGAWTFHTSKCDDDTLAFCAKYGLRIMLVIDGTRKEMGALLNRIAKHPHKQAIMSIQFGSDPSGGADPTVWRHVAAIAAKKLPGMPITLPIKDLDSQLFVKMRGYDRVVTQLLIDLRDTPAPFEKIHGIAEKLRKLADKDKSYAKYRLWAMGPGKLAGTPDDQISSPAAISWQMHWAMSALAEDLAVGVFLDRPYRPDDFGLAMRHFWATTVVSRSLSCHGEAATCMKFAPKPKRTETSDLLLEDEAMDDLELNDPHAAGPKPVACANVAKGKTGDIEYLAMFGEDLGEEEGRRVSLFVVNTSGERLQVKVDVNRNGGHVSKGFRRRLVPDTKTGKMINTTIERRSWPLSETVEPLEVTFFDFRIW